MYTRKEYVCGQVDHITYYSQFVTDSVLRTVRKYISLQSINSSSEINFNDIPLRLWDSLNLPSDSIQLLIEAGEIVHNPTLSAIVCVNKAAARKLRGLDSNLYPITPFKEA